MPITTDVLAKETTTTLVGFGTVVDASYFIDPYDSNLFTTLTAPMSASGATTNSAKLVLDFITSGGVKSKSTAPAISRTRRRLIYKYRLTNSLFNSSSGSTVRARIRYSVNSGSAWTIIQDLYNTTVGSTQDSGVQTGYIDLSISQDISMVKVELFAETISGSAGSTAVNTQVFGFHAYVEDYEADVSLLRIYPSGSTVLDQTGGDTNDTVDPTKAYDVDISTFSNQRLMVIADIMWSLNNSWRLDFPVQSIAGGIIAIQGVATWDAVILDQRDPVFAQITTTFQVNYSVDGINYVSSGDPDASFQQIGTPLSVPLSKGITLLVMDIGYPPTSFQGSDNFKIRGIINSFVSGVSSIDGGINLELKIYEAYLEVRVSDVGSSSGFAGWEAV